MYVGAVEKRETERESVQQCSFHTIIEKIKIKIHKPSPSKHCQPIKECYRWPTDTGCAHFITLFPFFVFAAQLQ